MHEVDTRDEKYHVVEDKSLVKQARGYIVDVCVYDGHFRTGILMKVEIL